MKENSNSYDFEHINLNEMFRPKDIIKAKVISVKRAKGNSVVAISTADTDLGVICAVSELSEVLMVPKSWKEFQCPKTNLKEKRKVAKPDYFD
mmetsp:Transcript_10143/g.10014  ORF Transcript_10143/g.10014 Transcript_10143/m.10014 type:complete len:93 (-) Transcript_10143:26-304(-)